MQVSRKFEVCLTDRPLPTGIDVVCQLKHFAILTYAVPTERFAGLFPERFELDTVDVDGRKMGLISVVPFIDVDFTSAVFPFPKFTMGQTNYRVYIIDKTTGEHCVWFLGTVLDSWTLAIPKYLWNLPWHSGKISFDCRLNKATGLYEKYHLKTTSRWAEASAELTQTTNTPFNFPGFPDEETAMVYLTHPLTAYYYRRDGKLGTYKVWHKKLEVRPAETKSAKFKLLSNLRIVHEEEQPYPYSTLIQPINEFTIYLPPKKVTD